MTVSLLDVNVLIALAWPNHIHHDSAHDWFGEHQGNGWATCPTTESGFVRLSSNPRLTSGARTPREAIALLRRIVALPHHVFWHDDVSLADSPWVATEKLVGFRQVTDAHLLALALERGGRLVSFDRGLATLLPPDADPGAVHLLTT